MSRILHWSPWFGRRADEPGSALFRGLHLRLTFWYSGVVVLALAACGIVLYFALQDLTLGSVRSTLGEWTAFQTQEWLRTPPRVCGTTNRGPSEGGQRPTGPNSFAQPARPPAPLPVYSACFDLQGRLLAVAPQAPGSDNVTPQAFLDSSLAAKAAASGTATDTVETGQDAGAVLRLATIVRDPNTGESLGVAQVGQSVELQIDTLRLVRSLLLLLIVLASLGSVAGGLLLADRALQPARLAFARQQAFIADASHQLRTPLTILRADAEVLLRNRDQLAPEDAELLEDIVAETAHMDGLATSLLSLARLDSGQVHLEHEVIDLSELAADVGRRVMMLAAENNLNVGQQLASRALLLGDHQAVEQAALILVENALKYTPSGGSVTLKTEASDGRASFVVEDTGAGMPPEQIAHIGERFYRGDPNRSRSSKGTGLGLAIAHRIATAHGGTLELQSTPGKGTRAILSFPTGGARG